MDILLQQLQAVFLIVSIVLHTLRKAVPTPYKVEQGISNLLNKKTNISLKTYILYYLDTQHRFPHKYSMPFEKILFFYSNWQP